MGKLHISAIAAPEKTRLRNIKRSRMRALEVTTETLLEKYRHVEDMNNPTTDKLDTNKMALNTAPLVKGKSVTKAKDASAPAADIHPAVKLASSPALLVNGKSKKKSRVRQIPERYGREWSKGRFT